MYRKIQLIKERIKCKYPSQSLNIHECSSNCIQSFKYHQNSTKASKRQKHRKKPRTVQSLTLEYVMHIRN